MEMMMAFSSHTVIERGTSSTHANCFSTSFTAFSAPSHIVIQQTRAVVHSQKGEKQQQDVTDLRFGKRWTTGETH